MNRSLKSGLAVVAAGALFAVGGMTSSVAAQLITGDNIAKNTITQDNLAKDSVGRAELQAGLATAGKDGKDGQEGKRGKQGDEGPQGPAGPAGVAGAQGPAGPSGQEGAFYAFAKYNVGDTNAGAIATVARSAPSQAFTAIAGDVQMIGLDGNATPVSSSFPGRMDWSTYTPKPDHLEGWIVQFAGAQENPPLKANVWALCVPRTNIPVVTTYDESD